MSARFRIKILVDRSWQVARDISSGAIRFAREHPCLSVELLHPSERVLQELLEHPGHAIITGGQARWLRENLPDDSVPIFNTTGDRANDAYKVVSDPRAAVRMVCAHFEQIGMDRVGFVGRRDTQVSRVYINTVADEAQKRGWHTCSFMHSEHHHLDGTRRIEDLMEQLDKIPLPAGLVCMDDLLARDVVDAALELGIQIPHDLAIVGNGNDQIICDHASVAISSIEQGADRRGYLAMKYATALLEEGVIPPRFVAIPPRLIIERTSTRRFAEDSGAVGQALRFIEDNLEDPITVEDVVRRTHVPRRTLYRDFRKIVGRSIGKEILRCRIQHARQLLLGTDMPIIDVAVRCGFASHASLTTAFKREVGFTPSDYRIRNLEVDVENIARACESETVPAQDEPETQADSDR